MSRDSTMVRILNPFPAHLHASRRTLGAESLGGGRIAKVWGTWRPSGKGGSQYVGLGGGHFSKIFVQNDMRPTLFRKIFFQHDMCPTLFEKLIFEN